MTVGDAPLTGVSDPRDGDRPRATDASRGRDLTRFRSVRRLLRVPAFQFVLVLPMLVLVAVATLSAGVGIDHPALNFGTVATWVVWWGGLLFSIALVGRAWCLVCPLGALGEWVQRLSLWWPSRVTPGFGLRWPRRLGGLWLPTALFVLFVFLDNGYGMSNSPRMTAGLVVVLALGALWTSVVFERRAFCRHLCPLTALIGLGALTAPLEIRRRDATVCARCAGKDCYAGNTRHWGCPMGEFPGGGMDTNLHCILCTECVRSCPSDNLGVRLRAPGQDLWTMRRARLDTAVSASAVVGITVVAPLFTFVGLPPLRAALAAVLPHGAPPDDPPRLVAIALLLAVGFAVTLALVAGSSALARWGAGAGAPRMRALVPRVALALVPIALARMLADLADHALRTWGAVGHVTRGLLLDFPLNRALAGQPAVTHAAGPLEAYALGMLLVLGGLALALVALRRFTLTQVADREAARATLIPLAALALVLTLASVWTLGAGLL
jgi:polyferredoxin